jgi:putative FmdB family regulatory protein
LSRKSKSNVRETEEKMPIFEYVCRKCGHHFEKIMSGGATAVCPACRSRKLEKQLSVFAAATRDATSLTTRAEASPAPCGSCGDPRGPGSCSRN